ncbi:hypothetical protein C5167_017401 [Papaver somniferum]|uniref:Uncharacterized protein n=1 Tax=Papaver somniferum TaxID=3469 RepID=A0A4Y7IJB1_PAPSO|nr:hypothetical protein C5167_017401 [Papaver somniferum]
MSRKMLIDGEVNISNEHEYDYDLFVIGAGSGGVEIGACVAVLFLVVLTKSVIMMGRSRGGLSQRSSGRVDPLQNFVSERSPIARQKPPTNVISVTFRTIRRLNSMMSLLALKKHMRTANKSYGESLSKHFRERSKKESDAKKIQDLNHKMSKRSSGIAIGPLTMFDETHTDKNQKLPPICAE